MFEKTRCFRTGCSLTDQEAFDVMRHLGSGVDVFVDYGCHLGHLSFEAAMLPEQKRVLSVDNWIGTKGDEFMARTMRVLTSGNIDFFHLFMQNYDMVRELCRARIDPYSADYFWMCYKDVLPFVNVAFIDSSHLPEDDWEYEALWRLIVPGGWLGGHDYGNSGSPNVKVAVDRLVVREDVESFHSRGILFWMQKKLG